MKKPALTSRLRHRVDILRPTGLTHDGTQNIAAAPAIIADVPAEYRPGAGGERFADAAIAATAPATFTVRWQPALASLDPSWLLRYPAATGRVFDIQRSEDDGRRRSILIFAVARADT